MDLAIKRYARVRHHFLANVFWNSGIATRTSPADLTRVFEQVNQWAEARSDIQSADLFNHPNRDTVRCAVISRDRAYDPALDDAVTELDLALAHDADLVGIDVEIRLFFAPAPEHVAVWLKGWEQLSHA